VALSRNLIPTHIFSSSFLPLVIRLINSRDPSVSSVWLDALLEAVPSLTKDVIRRDIVSLAVARSQLSQTVNSRKSGCLIFGAIAQKFEPFWLKREVFPQVKSLCQDVDAEVRITMCSQLHIFAKCMSPELAKSCVLPELTELTNDEEPAVREAALESIADVVPHLPVEIVRTLAAPLVVRICQKSLTDVDSPDLTGVARLLGKLSHQLKDVMTADLRDWFVKFYCQLSRFDDPVSEGRPHSVATPTTTVRNGMRTECRRLCAYNFPAMVQMVGGGGYVMKLSSAHQDLATDDSPRVRHTVASGYHEVVRLLGDKSMSAVGIYQKLLNSKSVEVLQGLAGHMTETLKGFAKSANLSPETKHPGIPELIGPLITAEGVAGSCRQWRLHEQIITGFSSLVHCLTTDQLYNKIVPILMKIITGKYVRPVKLASCQSLAVVTRHLRKADQRSAVVDRLNRECAQCNGCHNRLLYLDLCTIILTVFSRSFFKQHFFSPALALGNDSVVNVRLRLCHLLPALKTTLKLPGDRALLQDLDATVRWLLSRERDTNTTQAIRSAVLELDRIQVAMETLTRRTFFEADLIDRQKEDEERQLYQWEEREKDREAATAAGKKGSSTRSSPATQRAVQQVKKTKATRTISGPSSSASPNVSSHRSGSIPTLTPLTITSTPSPSSSPSTLRRSLAVPKPKGGVGIGGTSPPSIHRSQSGVSMTQCDSVESAISSGLLCHSVPGSPYSGVRHPRPKTSSSANSSPNSGTKSGMSRSREPSASKRKPPPHGGSLKGSKRT
jgi:serine/threonine-protein phosphatase 4 regulatory subunit 4